MLGDVLLNMPFRRPDSFYIPDCAPQAEQGKEQPTHCRVCSEAIRLKEVIIPSGHHLVYLGSRERVQRCEELLEAHTM